MTAIVAGPLLGGLVGSAVYYTISQTITNRTSLIRSELHDCSIALSAHSSSTSSFSQDPTPTSSQLSHPYDHYRPLSDQLRTRWNAILERTVTGLETTDWQNVLGGAYDAASGVVSRVINPAPSLDSTISPGRAKAGNLKAEENYYETSGYPPAPRENIVDALKHKISSVQNRASSALESAMDRKHAQAALDPSVSHPASTTTSTTNINPAHFDSPLNTTSHFGRPPLSPSSPIPSESVRKDVSFVKQEELALASTLREGKIPGSSNDPMGKRVEKALGVDDVGRGRLV